MFRSTISLTRALALVLALVVGPASAQMTLTGAGGTKAAAATNFLLINTGSALLINTGSKFLIK